MSIPSHIEFSLQQNQAIDQEVSGKAQIKGGPGTGKTIVLKNIYQRLISQNSYQDVLTLLFNSEAITNFTDSLTTIPNNHFHVFTIRQFWFRILSLYLLKKSNIHLIQMFQIDTRFLKSKYSSGSVNQKNYLTQQPSILYLSSYKILQMCQTCYKQDRENFNNYVPEYKYILIDEFQDIDKISFRLLLEIYNAKNIIVSGDDHQSLFSWTKITTLNSMQKMSEIYQDVKIFNLSESFRCTENIIITGQNLLKPLKHSKHKHLITKNRYNRPLYLKKYQSDKKQAENIVHQIKLLKKEKKIGYEEVGILCRRRKLQNNIRRALNKYNVPIFRENLVMDDQIEVILCVIRCYLNWKDFLARNILELYLKQNPNISITIEKLQDFISQIQQSVPILDLISSIAKLFKLGTTRLTYKQFTRYLKWFHPQSVSIRPVLSHLVRQTEIYPCNKGVSVISCLSMKGLQFKYVFVPGFNYYNYRYNSEMQQMSERKILYTTISRSSDYVCVSYFNVMSPLGLEFTKLSKKVMQLQLKLDEDIK